MKYYNFFYGSGNNLLLKHIHTHTISTTGLPKITGCPSKVYTCLYTCRSLIEWNDALWLADVLWRHRAGTDLKISALPLSPMHEISCSRGPKHTHTQTDTQFHILGKYRCYGIFLLHYVSWLCIIVFQAKLFLKSDLKNPEHLLFWLPIHTWVWYWQKEILTDFIIPIHVWYK